MDSFWTPTKQAPTPCHGFFLATEALSNSLQIFEIGGAPTRQDIKILININPYNPYSNTYGSSYPNLYGYGLSNLSSQLTVTIPSGSPQITLSSGSASNLPSGTIIAPTVGVYYTLQSQTQIILPVGSHTIVLHPAIGYKLPTGTSIQLPNTGQAFNRGMYRLLPSQINERINNLIAIKKLTNIYKIKISRLISIFKD